MEKKVKELAQMTSEVGRSIQYSPQIAVLSYQYPCFETSCISHSMLVALREKAFLYYLPNAC